MRKFRCLILIMAMVFLTPAVQAAIIVQTGSLGGGVGPPETHDIVLNQFDSQDGTLWLNFVKVDLLTNVSGGGQTSGEGGRPTHIHMEITADYFLGELVLGETQALVDRMVSHKGAPRFFSIGDTDTAQTILDQPEVLSDWIGSGAIHFSAITEMIVWENPDGGTQLGAGGSVRYTVTYDFSPLNEGVRAFSEGFEAGTNEGSWTWGTGAEAIQPLNGNPDAFLADMTLNSSVPWLRTPDEGSTSIFTGDYRTRGVRSLGVDLITLDASHGVGGRYLTVLLINNNGTPEDVDDDLWSWSVGDTVIPDPGVPRDGRTPAGWTPFEFSIPSQQATVPDGWEVWGQPGMTDDETWNSVITDVDQVVYMYGIPDTYYPFLSWDVGMDNARISQGDVYADLNWDGLVDVQDLQLLVHAFGPCDGCEADLNADGVVDRLDLQILVSMIVGHA